jgi:hypothetical protein
MEASSRAHHGYVVRLNSAADARVYGGFRANYLRWPARRHHFTTTTPTQDERDVPLQLHDWCLAVDRPLGGVLSCCC